MHAAIPREEELFNEGDRLQVGGHGAGRQLSFHGCPHSPSLSNLSYGYGNLQSFRSVEFLIQFSFFSFWRLIIINRIKYDW